MDRSRTFRALRLLAVIGVWVAVSYYGSPAEAHHSIVWLNCSDQPTPEPTLTPPPGAGGGGGTVERDPLVQDCTPDEGSVTYGTRTVRFDVDADSTRPITEVRAFLYSETDGVPDPDSVDLTCPTTDEDPNTDFCESEEDSPSSGSYFFTWNSNALTPHNAKYSLHVEVCASPHVNPTDCWVADDRMDLKVDNVPITPKSPEIVIATASSVSVKWSRAPEPDVTSYTLYRALTPNRDTPPNDNQFKVLLSTSGLGARDEITSPGAYWYKVQVSRRSVVAKSKLISSALSGTSNAGVVLPPPKKVNPNAVGPTRIGPQLPGLLVPQSRSGPVVDDAPFSGKLPYDVPLGEGTIDERPEAGGALDPRVGVLPVAVGAFLVSSALALGRMPY